MTKDAQHLKQLVNATKYRAGRVNVAIASQNGAGLADAIAEFNKAINEYLLFIGPFLKPTKPDQH